MSKPLDQPGRYELPEGWHWADWSGTATTQHNWDAIGDGYRARVWVRMKSIRAARGDSRPLPKEFCFFDRGIGKAKVKKPSPGVRVWFFQDGSDYYVSQITYKDEAKSEHDTQIDIGLQAREEHRAKRKKHNGT